MIKMMKSDDEIGMVLLFAFFASGWEGVKSVVAGRPVTCQFFICWPKKVLDDNKPAGAFWVHRKVSHGR